VADAPMIGIVYSCQRCGLELVTCDVPAREDEDVRLWMDRTVRLVWDDHARRSPHCHPDTLSEMRIPMTGADRIGGPAVQ